MSDYYKSSSKQSPWKTFFCCFYFLFFQPGFPFTGTDDSQDSRERGNHLYSSLPLPLVHELATWDDYHAFLIASHVSTRCYSMRFTTFGSHHLSNWWWNVDFYLLDKLILDFITTFATRKWFILTHIDYHLCIASQFTNQVLLIPNIGRFKSCKNLKYSSTYSQYGTPQPQPDCPGLNAPHPALGGP